MCQGTQAAWLHTCALNLDPTALHTARTSKECICSPLGLLCQLETPLSCYRMLKTTGLGAKTI
jgi:hypothetical protein